MNWTENTQKNDTQDLIKNIIDGIELILNHNPFFQFNNINYI